ncbi:MAG: hypothetical protein FKY71_08045 [Spiribacter salinus]|uniref:Uncharacterized protein n=1 Tax=Spiribacter salinus TaxID=1335746 RepID=A0A540VTT5_9GAMM|nr:MAG: hypothetical protein FKY71_08045 [Spiribacter salinus]
MTPQTVLTELLERIAASHGAPVLIGADELADWPADAVTALQTQGVTTKARPAVSVVCPGCERECVIPMYTPAGAVNAAGTFIVCDKRSDINRVPIPWNRGPPSPQSRVPHAMEPESHLTGIRTATVAAGLSCTAIRSDAGGRARCLHGRHPRHAGLGTGY